MQCRREQFEISYLLKFLLSVPLNNLPYCGTSFASKGNLKQHVEAIHEKKRDFACTVCNAKFYFKHKMEDHVKAKHLGKDLFRNGRNILFYFIF